MCKNICPRRTTRSIIASKKYGWGHMCAPTLFFYAQVPWKSIKFCGMWIQWPYVHIFLIWGQWPQMTPTWPLSGGHVCAHIPISFCPSLMKIHQGMWIQWPIIMIMHIWTIWDQWLQMAPDDLWPQFCSVARVPGPLPQYSFVQVPWKSIQYVGTWNNFARLNIFSTIYTHHTTLHSPFFS